MRALQFKAYGGPEVLKWGPAAARRWWTSWPWTATARSTPREPICSAGWADTERDFLWLGGRAAR
jgi:hypothetical protein